MEFKFSSWELFKFDFFRVYIKSVRNSFFEVLVNLRLVCNLMFYIMYLVIREDGINDKNLEESMRLGD